MAGSRSFRPRSCSPSLCPSGEEKTSRRLIYAVAVSALLVGAPLSSACNRRPDVKEQVQNSLKQANIDDVNVDWDKKENVVHLKGNVDSSTERQRAEQVATAAVGTSGKVLNELTVEDVNDKTADNLDGQIRDRLSEMVDRDQTLTDRDINFDVNNGVVTIKGDVRTAAEKNRVSELVKAAPGVKDFANGLRSSPSASGRPLKRGFRPSRTHVLLNRTRVRLGRRLATLATTAWHGACSPGRVCPDGGRCRRLWTRRNRRAPRGFGTCRSLPGNPPGNGTARVGVQGERRHYAHR